jgi:carbon monoxide dehydrogenase subunit G
MLHFEGDQDFSSPPENVWSKLTDARFLVQCIPGVESVSQSEPTRAACTLRPGFAFVRGTLDLTFEVVDGVPNTSARILLHNKGIGSSSEVEAKLAFTPQADGTRLHWTAEILSLGGLLKAIPQGLIKAAAQKVVADALAAVEAKLKS